jgi:hypothetical protein
VFSEKEARATRARSASGCGRCRCSCRSRRSTSCWRATTSSPGRTTAQSARRYRRSWLIRCWRGHDAEEATQKFREASKTGNLATRQIAANAGRTIAHKRARPLFAIVQEVHWFAQYDLGCASGGDTLRPVVDTSTPPAASYLEQRGSRSFAYCGQGPQSP